MSLVVRVGIGVFVALAVTFSLGVLMTDAAWWLEALAVVGAFAVAAIGAIRLVSAEHSLGGPAHHH